MSGRGKQEEKRYEKPNAGALHVRQIPEWGVRIRVWKAIHGSRWTYNGQKLAVEALVNALLLDFLDKPLEEQVALVNRILPPTQEQERKWWGEMDELIAQGLYEVDEDGHPVPVKPTKRARRPQHDDGHESTGGHVPGRRPTPTPTRGRKRA